ncbi:hypothetical protein L6164_022916 [Bauhinia variegata]|uniref:Uncharacterized protein n=1 Tax=Bauhinia variegata TaxID=167791 RepID=A0ACB9MHY6_BAUVA|nr:hypothetical protein L6164_022916 [Bauhinia variegata]
MAKKAVLIGCNYPGTKAELKGCVNDVRRMYKCLINRYGFLEDDITVLIDTDKSYTKPTGKNIRSALANLVLSGKPGDVLIVHYSGHGTRLPAETGEDDDTGYDECIVPCDMNLITDDDFREYVDKVTTGCKITIVSDSCHSGGLIEAAKEQIGDSTRKEGNEDSSLGFGLTNFLLQTVHNALESIYTPSEFHHQKQKQTNAEEIRDIETSHESCHHHHYGYLKSRSLPLPTLIEILKHKTGKEDIDVGKLRPTLYDMFGEDASPKVKKFMKFLIGKIQHVAQGFMSQKLEDAETMVGDKREVYAGVIKGAGFSDSGILISGCQSDQTSADASPLGNSEEAYGACSNVIQEIIEEQDGQVTNKELVIEARRRLRWQGFAQKPGLYCSDHNVDVPFIC